MSMKLWEERLYTNNKQPYLWWHESHTTTCPNLRTLQQSANGPVTDLGAAIVWAGLATPEIVQRNQRQGITLVYVGARHCGSLSAAPRGVLGIYKQHTACLDTAALCF